MMIRFSGFCLLALILFPTFGAARARADMCATEKVSADKVIEYFGAKPSTNVAAKKFQRLAQVGKDVIGVDSYDLCSGGSPEKTMEIFHDHHLVNAWTNQIASNPKWDKALSKKAVEKLKAEKASIQELFGAKSYGYAWVQKMTGDTTGAKSTLNGVFEERVEATLSSKAISRSFDNPLAILDRIHQALSPMGTPEEQKGYDQQLQRVKIHISNLPDSGIVT